MKEKSENQPENNKGNWWQFAIAVLFGIGIGGAILLLNKNPKPEAIMILPTKTETPILVHITGEVYTPGVYELQANGRVSDLIELAGGFTEKADSSKVNLASQVYDGQQIIIPAEEQSKNSLETNSASTSSATDGEDVTFPININYCTLEELMALPGIGQSKAEAIIEYRKENGDFQVIEDILKVSGIGEAIFEQIKDKITVQ